MFYEENGYGHNEWANFMIPSVGKIARLEAEISELGEWIAPVANDNLALLGSILDDVTKTWFDTNTGECNDISAFLEFLSSFKKVFNRRAAEIENLVKAATASRSKASFKHLASATTMISQRRLEAAAKAKAGNNI